MQGHQLEKIIVSIGVGKMRQNNAQFEEKVLPEVIKELGLIVGQRPASRKSKKSIAAFKVREGEVVGVVATLRGQKMEDFLSRLINVALPRVRDFRGISPNNFDSRGNLTIGIKEHTVFPEINPESSKVSFGLEVTFVAHTKNKEDGLAYYQSTRVELSADVFVVVVRGVTSRTLTCAVSVSGNWLAEGASQE
jgi:large subunit ribosomal protein L5